MPFDTSYEETRGSHPATQAYAYREPRAAPPPPAPPAPARTGAFPSGAPAAVTALAVILGISAVLSLVGAAYLLADGIGDGEGDGANAGDDFGDFLGFFALLAGLAQAAAVFGLLARRAWGWWTAAGVAAVAAFVNLIGVFLGSTLIALVGLLLAALVLAVCFAPSVLRWVGVQPLALNARRSV